MAVIKKIILVFCILLIGAAFYMWYFILPIPTGYAAKNLCSCLFVDGYDQSLAENNDLNFSLVGMTSNEVDYKNKTVRSTFWGFRPQVAVYRNSELGCTLKDKGEFHEITMPNVVSDTLATMDSLQFHMLPASAEERAAINPILEKTIRDSVYRTRALLVLHHGKIAGEQYAEPFDSNSIFIGWSMTKSVIATLIGILVQEGKINIDDRVPIEKWEHDPRLSRITWKDMLQMNAGLHWDEVYSWRSNATRMLYIEGDMYNYLTNFKPEFDPGTYWEYSSGVSNILSGLLRQVIGDEQQYHQFPFNALAEPIGMDHFVMETDAAGNFIGSSYSHATAREWARFGQLYLNHGVWNGKRIFPDDWSTFVSTPAPNSNGIFGAHFWLNADGHLPDVPLDVYNADGFMGQRVFILPSQDMVVVRLGLSLDQQPDFNALLKEIIAASISY
ncbi:MAG TPA: serine hydrolase [Saprospiraceae bacterium]|nr:serine hydrolase [Saprospiraceae bacterium]